MASYFLDDIPNKNGVRTVRSAFCPDLPDFYDRIYLGEYDRIEPALKKARTFHAILPSASAAAPPAWRITAARKSSWRPERALMVKGRPNR